MSEHQAMKTPKSELAQSAREHYEEISLQAHHHLSTIPQAIDAWEREPELIAENARLKEQLAQRDEYKEYLKDSLDRSEALTEAQKNSYDIQVAHLQEQIKTLEGDNAAVEASADYWADELKQAQERIDATFKTVVGLVLYADGHREDYARRATGNPSEHGTNYWAGRRDEAGHFKDRIEKLANALQGDK